MKTRKSDDYYLLDTVDNALSVLELLAQSARPLNLKAIASGLKLPKATAYRLVYTLRKRNFIERDQGNRSFRLGVQLLKLSAALQDQFQLGARSTPFLRNAVAEEGETANLGILCDGEVILVNKVQSPHSLRMDSPIGGREPVHCTAMGKVLLAWLPPDQIRLLVSSHKSLQRYTSRTITAPEVLISELEQVRTRGYALDIEECYVGLVCVGAPIRDCRGQVIAALSVSAPAARVDPAKREVLAHLAVKTAAQISGALGYSPIPISTHREV